MFSVLWGLSSDSLHSLLFVSFAQTLDMSAFSKTFTRFILKKEMNFTTLLPTIECGSIIRKSTIERIKLQSYKLYKFLIFELFFIFFKLAWPSEVTWAGGEKGGTGGAVGLLPVLPGGVRTNQVPCTGCPLSDLTGCLHCQRLVAI